MTTRILIVEDSALVADAYVVLFQQAGYEVEVATTVAGAIESASGGNVDVMLLDLSLPDGDGLEVLEGLRTRGKSPRTTLAMTGHDDSKTRHRCLDAGCTDVLIKPLPIAQLLRQIERHQA
ncbi:MAG: response regulator [Gemmatimonadaceae bacterium]